MKEITKGLIKDFESEFPLAIKKWKLKDYLELAQYAYALSLLEMHRTNKLTIENLDILSYAPYVDKKTLDDVLDRFCSSYPIDIQKQASCLRRLIDAYVDIRKTSEEEEARRQAIEAVNMSIKVMQLFFNQDIRPTIFNIIKNMEEVRC